MLKLSQEAGLLAEQFDELKSANDLVIRVARKQKRQLELMEEDRQKTNDEIKLIKLELRKAYEKIKDLKKEKLESIEPDVMEPDANENGFPVQDTLDLEMLVSDIDSKLAKKEEHSRLVRPPGAVESEHRAALGS
jgi:hypothetical protein